MNIELILKLIEPYSRGGMLTYDDFEKAFSMLSLREKYAVCEILNENGFELCDEYDDDEVTSKEENMEAFEIFSDNFDDLDNDDDDVKIEQKDEIVIQYSNIKQSNRNLIALIQRGSKQAENDLCVKNKNLVAKRAQKYFQVFGNNLEFEDLMQSGFIGMIKAARRFDLNRDNSFSTYAVHWIDQSISRAVIDTGFTTRIPVHEFDFIKKVVRYNNDFDYMGYEYNDRVKLIAEALCVSEEKVLDTMRIYSQFLKRASLDAPVNEDGDTCLGELIPYYDEMNIEKTTESGSLTEELNDVLNTLRPREAQVLRLRFGLEDGTPHTLEEIGVVFNVTRERIRQIEAKALRKLRHPSRSKKLKDFLE